MVAMQHETIEQLLERGEKLDDLVQKTDKLSGTSKAFYKEVRELESACIIACIFSSLVCFSQ